MATIGQALTSPETSWLRIDDNNSKITYSATSTWSISTSTVGYYNSSYTQSNQNGANIQFKFYGTKVRIISSYYSDKSNNIGITIDGIDYGSFSEYHASSQAQTLVFERIGMSLGTHTVKLTNNTSSYMMLDAIDIDDIGYLIHPILNIVSDLASMKIGDAIPCTYTATSGAVGTFSNLGVNSDAEIPVTGSATPNGLFYFIKVDKGLLVADRVIQHSVKWDTLNSGKMIEGNPLMIMSSDITNQSYIIDGGHYSGRNYAFDNNNTTYMTDSWESLTSDMQGWVGQHFPIPYIIKSYSIAPSVNLVTNAPIDWTFEGSNDGTNWEILHTIVGMTSWSSSETKYFNASNTNAYSYYRINVTKSGGTGFVVIGEIQMFETSLPLVFIRSLSGGCAYVDVNGNSSTTDKSLGAFPTINEWDKYIVNSDLMGKITKGDNNVWNWSGISSWTKGTPITAINTNVYRITRGNTSLLRTIVNTSTITNTGCGFRPVLEYLESDAKASTLFY